MATLLNALNDNYLNLTLGKSIALLCIVLDRKVLRSTIVC